MKSMSRILILLPFVFFGSLQGQTDSVERMIQRGDSLIVGTCYGSNFKHLDMYRKTRWQGNEPTYDTATGTGFFASFFATGDFDVAELPASYSRRKFEVIGVEVLTRKETGTPLNILYLRGDLPNSVIWVDFDEAFDSGEIRIPE
ncbi:MAG: hypothetical protein JNL57_05755 [Bacteroidetes bacterium]|nr:hypothetical protein [Bacteroidota bacterium]